MSGHMLLLSRTWFIFPLSFNYWRWKKSRWKHTYDFLALHYFFFCCLWISTLHLILSMLTYPTLWLAQQKPSCRGWLESCQLLLELLTGWPLSFTCLSGLEIFKTRSLLCFIQFRETLNLTHYTEAANGEVG